MKRWAGSPDQQRALGVLALGGVALLAGLCIVFGWVDGSILARWVRLRATPLALFASAAVCATLGLWLFLRTSPAPRSRVQAMSWWVVAGAAVLVIFVVWEATSWLLEEADTAKDVGAARVDAIKTGLGIGAGTTGIFALLLAVRRQWHNEVDATEKNVTELYTKAADQLGSPRAPVRLAGLYALERLAQNNPAQRESIINVICAYLRMPYDPQEATPFDTDQAPREAPIAHQVQVQEREVRLAAQRVLLKHLQPHRATEFWSDADLDLTGAYLINCSLRLCQVRMARFDGATFVGHTSLNQAVFEVATFDNVTFSGPATFNNTTFNIAYFVGAAFTNEARFHDATFDAARFDNATFTTDTWFTRTAFNMDAALEDISFLGNTRFDGATFSGNFSIVGSVFGGDTSFDGAKFTLTAPFDNVIFTRPASFADAVFNGGASFKDTILTGDTSFAGAAFSSARSWDNRVADAVSFAGAIVTNATSFANVSFNGRANFATATFACNVSFDKATYQGDPLEIAPAG